MGTAALDKILGRVWAYPEKRQKYCHSEWSHKHERNIDPSATKPSQAINRVNADLKTF
jgi:hypothetical protein